jgi:hypothetical protein
MKDNFVAILDPRNWSLVELTRGTPSYTRVQRALVAQAKRKQKQTRMTVNDLTVLRVCAETVLKTNKALKGDLRRTLRTACRRAKRHMETV